MCDYLKFRNSLWVLLCTGFVPSKVCNELFVMSGMYFSTIQILEMLSFKLWLRIHQTTVFPFLQFFHLQPTQFGWVVTLAFLPILPAGEFGFYQSTPYFQQRCKKCVRTWDQTSIWMSERNKKPQLRGYCNYLKNLKSHGNLCILFVTRHYVHTEM